MIFVDSTHYGQRYHNISLLLSFLDPGEHDPQSAYVVGGRHPDKSFLQMVKGQQLDLPKADLAQVHCCTIVKHIDTLGSVYQVQQTPRLRVSSASHELSQFAEMFKASVTGMGCPPLCVAADNHGSFTMVRELFLGILHKEKYADLPGFCDLEPAAKKIPVPLFPFRHMNYLSGGDSGLWMQRSTSRSKSSGQSCQDTFPGVAHVSWNPQVEMSVGRWICVGRPASCNKLF